MTIKSASRKTMVSNAKSIELVCVRHARHKSVINALLEGKAGSFNAT